MLDKKIIKQKPEEVINKPTDEDIDDFNNETTNVKYLNVEAFLNERYEFRMNTSANELQYKLINSKEWIPCNEDAIYTDMQRRGISFAMNNLKSLFRSGFVEKFDEFDNYFSNLPKFNEKDDYIEELANHIKVAEKERERFNTMFKKAIVRTVKQVYLEGYFNKHCFTIISDKQNIGKTSFTRFLCPKELENYYTQNFGLGKKLDKDDMLALCENIMINIDDMNSLGNAEIKQLKALFSQNNTKVRKAYDSRARTYYRKASFWASGNHPDFLEDETGNIRWICFEIQAIDFNYSKVCKIDNIYSQAMHLFKIGYNCELTREEQEENTKQNIRFSKTTLEQELLMQYFEPDPNELPLNFYTSTQILDKLNKRVATGIKISTHLLGRALKTLGYDVKTKRVNYCAYPIKGYYFLDKGVEPLNENIESEPITSQ